MVKRTFSICFLFLAGIILIGHAIIPHQHHLTEGRVIKTPIHHHPDNDLETPDNHSHEHDGSSTKHIILEQVVITRSSIVRAAPVLVSGPFFDFDHSQLLVSCSPYIHEFIIPESSLFRRTDHQKPLVLFIIHDNQLRGPPVS